MPPGKIHDNIAFITTIPIFLAGKFIFRLEEPECIVLVASAFFAQVMFGPDLDTKSTQFRRWGAFKWIWIPYQKFLSHRCCYTHGLLLGPVIRCIYFIMMLIIVIFTSAYLVNYFLEINFFPLLNKIFVFIVKNLSIEDISIVFIPSVLGFFIGTAIHTLTDKVSSFFKGLF